MIVQVVEVHLVSADLGGSVHILDIAQANSAMRHSAQLNGNCIYFVTYAMAFAAVPANPVRIYSI